MNTQLTDLTIILDRSGSMQCIRGAMEKALDQLIADQRDHPGCLVVSLVRFDDEPETVFSALPASKVRPIQICPRGCTALLDAVGQAIDRTGERLAAMSEALRPAVVLFVIVTDGEENASRHFSFVDVQSRIRHQSETYQWQFVFLGTNIDAIATASRLGIAAGDALNFAADTTGVADAAASASHGLSAKRHAILAHQAMPQAFGDHDRKRQSRAANP